MRSLAWAAVGFFLAYAGVIRMFGKNLKPADTEA